MQGRREIPCRDQTALCPLWEGAPDDTLGVADPSTYDLTDARTRLRDDDCQSLLDAGVQVSHVDNRGPAEASPTRSSLLSRRGGAVVCVSVIATPETHYAVLGGDHIAYQVVGSGPIDLVFVPQWFSNVEALWDVPSLTHFVERLAGFSRVLLFDKRGTGISDALSRSTGAPFLENFSDDLRAVLDAAGFDRPAIVAGDSAGLMAIVFAASHPQWVSSLVLVSAYANLAGGDAALVRSTPISSFGSSATAKVSRCSPRPLLGTHKPRRGSCDISVWRQALAPRLRRDISSSRWMCETSSPRCKHRRS